MHTESDNELLQQCIASGQVDASQLVQHAQRGDIACAEKDISVTTANHENVTAFRAMEDRGYEFHSPQGVAYREGWHDKDLDAQKWGAVFAAAKEAEIAELRSQLETARAIAGSVRGKTDADIERAIRLLMQRIFPDYSLEFYEVHTAAVLSQMKEPK